MRSDCARASLLALCALCVAGGARADAPFVLNPDSASLPDTHVARLHQDLLIGAATDSMDIVTAALAMGADINVVEDPSKTLTPLAYAAENGHAAMTRFLLARGADPNGRGVYMPPLFWAVSNNQAECVRILLRHGADAERIIVGGLQPIAYAATDGDVAIVQMLIGRMPHLPRAEARRYLRQALNIALSNAAGSGSLSLTRSLVASGAQANNLDADANQGTGSPLMRATSRGSLPVMKFLLAHGALVNGRDSQNRTALMHLEQVDADSSPATPGSRAARLLLRHGAQIELRDSSGMTALMYAAQGNWRATVLLLARGAQVNARDGSGRTALHWAASMRDFRSLRALLSGGAWLNVQDRAGATPLMLASVQPDSRASATASAARRISRSLLLRRGANTRLKDTQGRGNSDYSRLQDSDFISAG